MADIGGMLIKLDEVVRMVDELPLLATPEPRRRRAARRRRARSGAASAAAAIGDDGIRRTGGRSGRARQPGRRLAERVWSEVRSLVRVTRIDHPDAMLIAPEQSYFLRENLKLRLLNARLALLSRQFDTAQSDLRTVVGDDRALSTTPVRAAPSSRSRCCARSRRRRARAACRCPTTRWPR